MTSTEFNALPEHVQVALTDCFMKKRFSSQRECMQALKHSDVCESCFRMITEELASFIAACDVFEATLEVDLWGDNNIAKYN